MKNSALLAISPLDGRYSEQLADLQPIFSEFNLMRLRVATKIEWLIALSHEKKIKEVNKFSRAEETFLRNIITKFSEKDAKRIKALEQQTRHDIKAAEYFLKEKISAHKTLSRFQEFIHFSCTSDDVNNIAYALMLKEARNKSLIPQIKELIEKLRKLAHQYAATPMLARTHGQPALPTTMGKEIANFVYRLKRQLSQLEKTEILGKFNGAIGNYNAHYAAYPEIDWQKVSRQFVTKLGLTWNPYTTQIEPHDWIAEYCSIIARVNTILIGMCRDIWSYISLDYFKQKAVKTEVGSSTLPHKVNPIDFENSEGNLGLANALFDHFANKLPISRWQRDLTDSTVMRNIGVALAHAILAYKSLLKGLNKIEVNREIHERDLNGHCEILAESFQTVMRRYGIKNPYETMKALTRGQCLSQEALHIFVQKLSLPKSAKERLLKLTPLNYLGKAIELAKKI